MGNDPISTALVGAGLLIIVWAFRDRLLASFGFMSSGRAEHLMQKWLIKQGYSIRRVRSSSNFHFVVADPWGREIDILWQKTPFVGVGIVLNQPIPEYGDDSSNAEIWKTARPSELRALQLHLLEVGVNCIEVGSRIDNLWNATPCEASDLVDRGAVAEQPVSAFQVIYATILPRDQVNYEEFFRRLNMIIGCKILSWTLITNLVETLRERQTEQVRFATENEDANL
jgi:hypothetical protein